MDKNLQAIENKLNQMLVVLIDNNRYLQSLNNQLGEFLSVLEIKSYEAEKNDEEGGENFEDPWKTEDDSE